MPVDELFLRLSAPARRALEGAGIRDPQALSQFTEAQVLALHGIGKNAMATIKKYLEEKKLTLKTL